MSLILDLIFPKKCYICGQFGHYICPGCYPSLNPNSIIDTPDSVFEGRLSLFPYKDAVQSIIHDLKYNYVTDLLPDLACLINYHLHASFPHLLSYWSDHKFKIVPIPLHPRRQNWRGFNQSEALARQLLLFTKIPVLTDLIQKKDNTSPQAQLNRSTRSTNPHSFSLSPGNSIRPQNIILFDDVYTTGSTIKSAAACLHPHVSNIWVFTLAG